MRGQCRRLIVVLGDQLLADHPLIAEMDRERDIVLMMEVMEESRHVPSHVQRTVLFLSAMRHYVIGLAARGVRVRYVALDATGNTHSFSGELERAIQEHSPERVEVLRPGEWRVLHTLESACKRRTVPFAVREDPHFLCTPETFARWAHGRKSLVMEHFYREQRRRTGYLMNGDQPDGGEWNFDHENREAFGESGPPRNRARPTAYEPDEVTREVIACVQRLLPDLYGTLESDRAFRWPVTRGQALEALADFCQHRLPLFGRFEDAMWSGEETLYHSRLSPLLNLKLLSPRECCEAAIAEYKAGRAPLASVEAFVRQIIGWREFIRGVYWLEGPDYEKRNGLDQHGSLPEFYWTGDTDMRCMRECLGQVVRTGYGHHIQRLMITGNFALIAGVHPKAASDWYLGMFVDGVDWVTLPNALGMVMHADRREGLGAGDTGLVGTKPYAASANYIGRMSDYCRGCGYDPKRRVDGDGRRACPFNTFYWDFLLRTGDRLKGNRRMTMALSQARRMKDGERVEIQISAKRLRQRFGVEPGNGIAPTSEGPSLFASTTPDKTRENPSAPTQLRRS